MDRLKALAIFKAVVVHRGFSRAADAMYLSPALGFHAATPQGRDRSRSSRGPAQPGPRWIDVAHCSGADLPDTLIARRLADSPLGTLAAPSYVSRRRTPIHKMNFCRTTASA